MSDNLVSLSYLGYLTVDPHLTDDMLRWIHRQILRQRKKITVLAGVEDGYFKAFNEDFELIVIHPLESIVITCFKKFKPYLSYMVKHETGGLITCYLFCNEKQQDVKQLARSMREPQSTNGPSRRGSNASISASVIRNMSFQTNGGSVEYLPWSTPNMTVSNNLDLTSELQLTRSNNASNLISLNVDLSPSESHFFEVLYVGKVKISQKKVPDSLIDDALIKFAQHEATKAKINQLRRNSLLAQTATTTESDSDYATNSPFNEGLAIMSSPSTTPLRAGDTSWRGSDILRRVTEDEVLSVPTENVSDLIPTQKQEKNTASSEAKTGATHTEDAVPNGEMSNLPIVSENDEKQEDWHSIANSIANFCRESLLKDDPAQDVQAPKLKSTNPFLVDSEVKEGGLSRKQVEKTLKEVTDLIKRQSMRQDSPAPNSGLEFGEIARNPKRMLRSKSGFEFPENKHFFRDRSASIGSINLNLPVAPADQNRTMLFQVGRSDLRLISTDMKQILYERHFRDVVSCVSGIKNGDHFGFVCRNLGTVGFCCFVFKCESESITAEIISAIKQAFYSHAEFIKKQSSTSCDHCPILKYHRLCAEIEGLEEKRAHALMDHHISELPVEEREPLLKKYMAGIPHMLHPYSATDRNTYLMSLMRQLYEEKQARHVHDTVENRSEFLNQYLGGNAIFMKAKRSLSSGFESLLKRKSSRDDGKGVPTKEVFKYPTADNSTASLDPVRSKSNSPQGNYGAEITESYIRYAAAERDFNHHLENRSPIMGIFMKVGDARSSNEDTNILSTWRQALFRKIQPADKPNEELSPGKILGFTKPKPKNKRTRAQLRELWRLAIDQTILLVRMEKENERIRQFAVDEKEFAVRRIKLEYDEFVPCDAAVSSLWTSLFSNRQAHLAKIDHHMLTQAVKQGVPRLYRGTIWYFLAEQQCMQAPPVDTKKFPLNNTPYQQLLGMLTKYQHAILIDIGRTFPQHSYFQAALGPGQLALYNILKAYSLLDPDLGYCQGLSFVAATLLLHTEERDAFDLLRHLMLRRGLRDQYLPNMVALHVKLYQLSRLVYDYEPELHAKLNAFDISPALYAAPWLLTLFTSHFPIGFAVRVFDLIFLESSDIVLSVCLALLSVHKDALMSCENNEECAEYLKIIIPSIDKVVIEKVMKLVYSYDLNRQLINYAVEYKVLREELPRINNLVAAHKDVVTHYLNLAGQLDAAMQAIQAFQSVRDRDEIQIKGLEHQLIEMSKYLLSNCKSELPPHLKKFAQSFVKKSSSSSKKSNKTPKDDVDNRSLRSRLTSPNFFPNPPNSPEKPDQNRFMMHKSQSVQSGLIANIRNGKDDTDRKQLRDMDNQYNAQINQERMFEQQLKHDFDENLRRLDNKMTPPKEDDDEALFRGKKPKSLKIAIKRRGGYLPEHREDKYIQEPYRDEAAGGVDDDAAGGVVAGGEAAGGEAAGGVASGGEAAGGVAAGGEAARGLAADGEDASGVAAGGEAADGVAAGGEVAGGMAAGGEAAGGMAAGGQAVGREPAAISHPLYDCDVKITYDGQLTELKKFRPYTRPKMSDDQNNNN